MSRTPKWTVGELDEGVEAVRFSSWRYYSDYIHRELLDYKAYIYRGHADADWKLEPTLDRIIASPDSKKRQEHLDNFKFAVRGRRGRNPPTLHSDNEWWALGQHHGLKTPLLDWTESPFVALYFAVLEAANLGAGECCVWAIHQGTIQHNNSKILGRKNGHREQLLTLTVQIVNPMSDENARLVSQRGLFTRGPNNVDLEEWIQQHSEDDNICDLIKLVIPRNDLGNCLRYLNRMNINHATLFPDLHGASLFCNKHLSIEDY